MKEIGGYFGVESIQNGNGEYYSELIDLNTGRNALLYIAKAKRIKRVYIPYFLCDSIYRICERENIDYQYYNIDKDFIPIFENILKDDEYLYIVNFYGQLSNQQISELKKKYGRIIVDNTHAFFQKPVDGVDTTYSCRKFFGVPDGAYLATDCILGDDLPKDNSEGRTSHIYGRIKDGATAHYAEFKENE